MYIYTIDDSQHPRAKNLVRNPTTPGKCWQIIWNGNSYWIGRPCQDATAAGQAWMVSIPSIKMVMAWGWRRWHWVPHYPLFFQGVYNIYIYIYRISWDLYIGLEGIITMAFHFGIVNCNSVWSLFRAGPLERPLRCSAGSLMMLYWGAGIMHHQINIHVIAYLECYSHSRSSSKVRVSLKKSCFALDLVYYMVGIA